jgi:hypothetical protein
MGAARSDAHTREVVSITAKAKNEKAFILE